MMANIAQSRSAIAAGSAPKAYAIHLKLNERDARDTAVSQCGAGDCKVVAAFTLGQCAAVVRARSRGRDVEQRPRCSSRVRWVATWAHRV
ncbi:TPA: DUF4189 domain-containing protein [Stenotrophomonas maltophilia]|nr:DUF4189 domain-containing protein [Stenotrophomonas maltophilia]